MSDATAITGTDSAETQETQSSEVAEGVADVVPETNDSAPEVPQVPDQVPDSPEAPNVIPDTPASAPPATPNKHNLPDVSSEEYDKVLVSEDEEVAADDSVAKLADESVTSNFTAKFFPPSPDRSKGDGIVEEDGSTTVEPNDSAAASNTESLLGAGASSATKPPTEYVVNENPSHFDDDISTLANETIMSKYMSGNKNNAKKPDPIATSDLRHPGAADVSSGASQLSGMHAHNDNEDNNDIKDVESDEQTPSPQSGSSPQSKSTVVGEVGENKSTAGNYSLASSYKRFRGGSGWTRRNYIFAFALTFFLLAIIAGLAFTFHTLQEKEEELAKQQQNKQIDDPGLASDDSDNLTFRPTAAPTIDISLRPTDLIPSSRPTRTPTSVPSRSPSIFPSIGSEYPSPSPSRVPSSAPSSQPSAAPTVSPEGLLRGLLAEVTSGNTLQAIEIRGTPQQKAFQWLVKDPNFRNYLKRRQTQRFALAVFYYSVTKTEDAREPLATWMNYDTNECTWFTSWFENRFACGRDDIYKFLTLRNVNLVGQLPSELAMLTRLESLVLRDNGLSGKIPNSFGEWSSLQKLDLRGNFLTGQLPKFKAGDLKSLDVSWNGLEGKIPSNMTALTLLESVDFTENFLTGTVPDELCSMGLQTLAVDCNEIRCSCCTKCGVMNYTEETRFPVAVPPTPPTPPPTPFPTPPPTPPPTPVPTPPPTPYPTLPPTPPPTPGPTRPPTPWPTRPPTPPPTPGPTRPPTPWPTPFPTVPPTPGPTTPPTPPPTPGPTRPPTPWPTRRPTLPPTLGPTLPPTPGPTRPPTRPPTPWPTPFPTPPPTPLYPTFSPVVGCTDIVQVEKSCYVWAEQIIVNYMNCNPLPDSWIGIYSDSVGIGQHSDPNLWKYACNSQSCSEAIARGTVIMNADAVGSSFWPLAPGEYKAWLFQRIADAPFPAIVGSTKFRVSSGAC